MAETVDLPAPLVSCNNCRWSDRKRVVYAHGGCVVPSIQDRFWQTGAQVRCGLFTGITIARRKLIDDRKRTVQQESLF